MYTLGNILITEEAFYNLHENKWNKNKVTPFIVLHLRLLLFLCVRYFIQYTYLVLIIIAYKI